MGVRRVEAVGDYRRRVDVIEELVFIIETDNFPGVISRLERYGGRTPLLSATRDAASFALSSGVTLRIHTASPENWGAALVLCTGSKTHLRKLAAVKGRMATLESKGPFPTEEALYANFGLSFIEPELREGYEEVKQAARKTLPVLVTIKDIRGELHAHSTSSDGSNSIEQMAVAARAHGCEYIGITDHSQSLKIARGVSVEDLWKQIRFIDQLNERLGGIRILKSAEVDNRCDTDHRPRRCPARLPNTASGLTSIP
jgi:DNA polymerase (family 10)